jgi:hypothetical protein
LRNFLFARISILAVLIAAVPPAATAAPSEADVTAAPLVETYGVEARAADKGGWRTRVQPVFNARERRLERRAYTVWDPDLSRDLDFSWTPANLALDHEGRISGQGRLVWRDKSKPGYDRASIVAQYDGALMDGKPEGKGAYIDRTGLSYDGEWKNGLMEGTGRLVLPDGDEYIGEMRAGKAAGAGRAVDVTGETLEGHFVDGARDGVGQTQLPNGARYRSTWIAGREIEDSRRIRIAQSGGGVAIGGAEDVRIAISIDKSKMRDDQDFTYAASSNGPRMVIAPANNRLMSMWKGAGDIELKPEEEGEFIYGIFSVSKGQLIPLTLNFEVQNRSTRPIDVSGAYLAVQSSVSDLKPAIQLNRRGEQCGPGKFNPLFWAENFGWGAAQDASLNFAFAAAGLRPSRFDLRKSIGTIGTAAKIDLESDLRAAGVNIAELKAKSDAGIKCSSSDQAECLASLRSSGLFGRLASRIDLTSSTISVPVAGTLDYSWQDAQGAPKRASSPFMVNIELGHTVVEAECGEGGEPDVIAAKPIGFILDRSNYRLPIAFSRRLAPSTTGRLFVTLEAPKSSEHDFTVVLQLADGSEVRSRPIGLTYYKPSWFPKEPSVPN